MPEFFADHIGNLTVELVLATVEISTLLIRVPPTLETLALLQEAEAFPGNDPEGKGFPYRISRFRHKGDDDGICMGSSQKLGHFRKACKEHFDASGRSKLIISGHYMQIACDFKVTSYLSHFFQKAGMLSLSLKLLSKLIF